MLRVGVKRLPQGYGSSGNGYSRKTDEILTTSPGAPDNQDFDTIVHDVVVWNNNLEEAFFRVCNIITNSNITGGGWSTHLRLRSATLQNRRWSLLVSSSVSTGLGLQMNIFKQSLTSHTTEYPWYSSQISYCFSASPVMAQLKDDSVFNKAVSSFLKVWFHQGSIRIKVQDQSHGFKGLKT